MKPLYKFKKKKKKKIHCPLPPSYKARTLPLTRVDMIRTAYPLQGAQYCTDLKEDPCHPPPTPRDEALWVDSQRGEAETKNSTDCSHQQRQQKQVFFSPNTSETEASHFIFLPFQQSNRVSTPNTPPPPSAVN